MPTSSLFIFLLFCLLQPVVISALVQSAKWKQPSLTALTTNISCSLFTLVASHPFGRRVRLSVCLLVVCLSVCLSVCLPVCLSVCDTGRGRRSYTYKTQTN